MPYPPDKGDRIRAFHLIKYLARRCSLYVAALADEPISPDRVRPLRALCARVQVVQLPPVWRWVRALGSLALGGTVSEGAFHSAALRRVVRSWAREQRFDGVVISASSMVPYLRMAELRHLPAVVDLVDVDSQKWLKFAAHSRWPRSWVYGTEGRRLQQLEGELPGWTRGVTLVSEAEVKLLQQYCVPGTVQAVRNGVDLEYFTPQARDVEPSCVFTGALNYMPNVDGICWFCREVWPSLHRRRPDAKVYVVGHKPSSAVRQLAAIPGVQVVGPVPDVRPYLARSAVAIVPLRVAQGVQNKALEAMAMGKAVVTSTQVLGGLHAKPGKHLLAASAVEEWVEHVLRLFDQTELRQQLGKAGRQFVEQQHQWDRNLAPIGDLLGLPEPGSNAERGA
jgi:sugar transferase (PEP-CTERM/EpsH1 system associated)